MYERVPTGCIESSEKGAEGESSNTQQTLKMVKRKQNNKKKIARNRVSQDLTKTIIDNNKHTRYLDGFVLLVEARQIRHEVLHDVHVRERVYLRRLSGVAVDALQTRERVRAVDVHRTGAADALFR